jgi:hypothetical protein
MAEKSMKSAILKSLADFNEPVSYRDLYNHAISKKYINPADYKGKTPDYSWSRTCSDFIIKKDTRVQRVKNENGIYCYYLANKETQITFPKEKPVIKETESDVKIKRENNKIERALHKLFVSYLNNKKIYAKTIFHENSSKEEKSQKWTHPDIVGVKFIDLEKSANDFLKVINVMDMFDIYSYELKIEIESDADLKMKYFQAVSNSSWANYGYLIATEINGNLFDELKRLNQSFGIGFIKLSVKNPFESEVICPARYKNLDFNTISKLCKQNQDFADFIDKIRRIIISDNDKTTKDVLYGLEKFCDEYFGENEDDEIEKYCKDKHIPVDEDAD